MEELEEFPLVGDRTFAWLAWYTLHHGGAFHGRHTKWMLEQKFIQDSVAGTIHDLLGLSMELALCYDQVNGFNMACSDTAARADQLVEETGVSLQIEGLEHYIGRDAGGGLRRGIALAPGLATHATEQQPKKTATFK